MTCCNWTAPAQRETVTGHFGPQTFRTIVGKNRETLRTYLKVETLRTGALLLFTARSARACLILHRVGV